MLAETFLKKAQQSWKDSAARKLGDTAMLMLLQLPWGGTTTGFDADSGPMHVISHYLSDRWLRSTHIDQQLDVLRLDLRRSGVVNCEVVSPYMFDLLVQMYRAREATPYRKGGHGVRRNI